MKYSSQKALNLFWKCFQVPPMVRAEYGQRMMGCIFLESRGSIYNYCLWYRKECIPNMHHKKKQNHQDIKRTTEITDTPSQSILSNEITSVCSWFSGSVLWGDGNNFAEGDSGAVGDVVTAWCCCLAAPNLTPFSNKTLLSTHQQNLNTSLCIWTVTVVVIIAWVGNDAVGDGVTKCCWWQSK